ncbi:MAG: heparan-alpha-glucosaminide N-acetyltransferase domain-containing protein [Bryobacteraceae bacterium]
MSLPATDSHPAARYASIDAYRGLIMILMAIDHSSAFIARQHGSEFWAGAMSAYDAAFPFLTRWITHLCAPGFFFLMGAGVYWFGASRRQSGWTEAAVIRRTVGRGAALLLIAQILETPLMVLQSQMKAPAVSLSRIAAPPPNDGSSLYWALITLSGLGLVLIACGLLLRLAPWTWLLTAALSVFATNTLLPASGAIGPMWHAILLAPGISQHLLVVYPVIPWLGVAAAGMFFGYWWRRDPVRAASRVPIVGAIFLLSAIALRAVGGWGNIRAPRDAGWIEFLNNVKYPPSLVFWTMAVGIGLLLVAILIRLPRQWTSVRSPLIVFGQTPLFFYLAHFYLLTICGLVLFREPGSLEMAYLVWACVLVALYPVCVWYRGFKMTKPKESLWRMF